MDAAEYKHIVLGLIFVKYISDTFQTHRAELAVKFADINDEFYLADADAALVAEELEQRDYYKEANVFWVPEAARWEVLRAQAKQADIGKRIDDALALIETENPKLKGILDKRYARVQLPDGKLGELVDLVSKIGFGESGNTAKNHARDLLGQVYEYFLGQFASAEGKRGGQFYTPASIVKTLVAVLAPHNGRVYDPCCGSGGMFVQSEKFIEAHGGKNQRRVDLRPRSQPHHLAAGGDEPRHSRYRLQPRQRAQRHLCTKPAQRFARRFRASQTRRSTFPTGGMAV
jgi:type I restriction enzyme M protein